MPHSVDDELSVLPDPWWRNPGVMTSLRGLLGRHLLPLHVIYRSEGVERHAAITGFLLERQETPFWITAGHCWAKLLELKAHPKCAIGACQWIDGYSPGGEFESGIPVSLESVLSAKVEHDFIDLAAVHLRDFYVAQIQANPNTQFLNEQAYRPITTCPVDCHVIAGFPGELWSGTRVTSGQKESSWRVGSDLLCAPLSRVPSEAPRNEHEGFWGRDDAFYARIHLDSQSGSARISDIGGMSGGPIFSINRRGGDLRYRVAAVQSSWLPDSHVVRATPIELLITGLDACLAAS